ncbi:MAG TPA: hypothetical protein VKV28_16105 [Candidatus Binataceae bacterium]|nr:hypothetical protein [Candidatus Binataceae bacterium]
MEASAAGSVSDGPRTDGEIEWSFLNQGSDEPEHGSGANEMMELGGFVGYLQPQSTKKFEPLSYSARLAYKRLDSGGQKGNPG